MTTRHPRAHESDARRAQLDRLKVERRSARRRLPPQTQPQLPTYRQAVAELQRIAMGGVMPSPDRFDYAKPAHWPRAAQLCDQFGVTWADLADAAGLQLTRQVNIEEKGSEPA